MPDLKEFTLCMWHKFYNHSSDHPLFSYASKLFKHNLTGYVDTIPKPSSLSSLRRK